MAFLEFINFNSVSKSKCLAHNMTDFYILRNQEIYQDYEDLLQKTRQNSLIIKIMFLDRAFLTRQVCSVREYHKKSYQQLTPVFTYHSRTLQIRTLKSRNNPLSYQSSNLLSDSFVEKSEFRLIATAFNVLCGQSICLM